MLEDKQTVAAVVVTYNRLELLKKCIQSLKEQTRKLDEIIVVNNSSTDGTLEWLNSQTDLISITQENSGSAGGQYTGIKTAYEKGYDWVWSLDTDVVVDKNALENFFLSKGMNKDNIGFLSSTIFYKDGSLAYINIPFLENNEKIVRCYAENEELPILSASFGSVLFSRNAIMKVGFPNKEFFIWGDDVEYTFRIIRAGFIGFLINNSNAIHYAPTNSRDPFVYLPIKDIKMTLGVRNTVAILIVRGDILRKSRIKGLLSSLNFVAIVVIHRIKNNIKDIINLPYLILFFLQGIIFYYKQVKKYYD